MFSREAGEHDCKETECDQENTAECSPAKRENMIVKRSYKEDTTG